MLLARVLTALVLGPAVVAGIVFLPAWAMQTVFALVVFIGALEWSALSGIEHRVGRIVYASTLVAVMVAVYAIVIELGAAFELLGAATVWWLVATLWVVSYQLTGRPLLRTRGARGVLGWLVLVSGWCSVSLLLVQEPRLLLAFFAMIWSADVFAYFGGKTFGRRRLASRVSPGKTWEGVACALAGTLLLAGLASPVLRPSSLPALLAVVAVSVLVSIIGDLVESLLKRSSGAKDSGSLLPGHGGVLDRIDSTLAAAPVFTLGLFEVARS